MPSGEICSEWQLPHFSAKTWIRGAEWRGLGARHPGDAGDVVGDAEDVANYVASVAGVPGAKPPPLGSADQVFAEKCGSCHSLEKGGPDGTGPNLANALPGKSAAFIRKQIVEPNSNIYPGFQPDIMPQDFESQIPPKNLDQLVNYLLEQVNGGGK